VKKSVFDGDDSNREDIYEGNNTEEVSSINQRLCIPFNPADASFYDMCRRRKKTFYLASMMRKATNK
jgi:hypothetical protein